MDTKHLSNYRSLKNTISKRVGDSLISNETQTCAYSQINIKQLPLSEIPVCERYSVGFTIYSI